MATAAPDVSTKDLWRAERRTFVGGSDIYQLLNEKQYGKGCVRALAYDKMGTPPDYPEQIDDAILERGNILEPIVAEAYSEQTGRKLRRPPFDENGMPKAKRHPEYPWAGVHVDRIILAGSGGVTETGTAEIKTRGEGPYYQLLRNGLFNGDNLQIQHGMWINNHPWGAFITLGVFGGLPLKHFDVKRDEPTIEIIKQEGDKFADRVWGQGQLPDRPFTGDDDRCKVCAYRMECRGEELDAAMARAMKAEKAGKTPLVQISNPVLAQALADRELIKAEMDANEETCKLVETTIKRELGDNDAVLVDGYGKVYHKEQAGRTTAELGKLMEYLRDLAKQAEEIESVLSFNSSLSPEAAQALIVLHQIKDMPSVVSSKFCKVGNPFRSLRVYPAKVGV